MTGIIPDSDILIELLRDHDAGTRMRFELLLVQNTILYYGAVSGTEIGHGARESERDGIQRLLGFLHCIGASCRAGTEAGALLKQYYKSHGVGLGDALIAGTAITNGLSLWTRNRKHYPDPRIRFMDQGAGHGTTRPRMSQADARLCDGYVMIGPVERGKMALRRFGVNGLGNGKRSFLCDGKRFRV